jgi:Transposase IS66 family
MAVRSRGERLVWLFPLVSRAAESVLAALRGFTGYVVVDGYSCYQQLLATAKGIQQCVAHYAEVTVMPTSVVKPLVGRFLAW